MATRVEEPVALVRRGAVARALHGSPRSGGGQAAGWVVVLAVATILMATSGARFLFGVVLKPVTEQFGWSRASLTGAVMLGMVTISLCQPFVGAAVDRLGAKRVLVAGTVLLGGALIPLSLVRELWQVYALYGLVAAVGLAATSPVIAATLVGGWFQERRGAAMAVATSGSAFGQLLIVPVATWTLTLTDWPTTYRLLAGLLLVLIVPLGLLALREAPAVVATAAAVERDGVPLAVAVRTPEFWLLALGFLACGFTMAFPNTHFLAYADDMGMATTHAANAVAVTAVLSIVGSVGLGVAADRWRRSGVLALTYLLRGAAFALLLLPTDGLLFVYAAVLGISWTATTPLTATITADLYGRRHLGAVFGTMFIFMNLGFGLGAVLDGVVYELAGGYRLALFVNAAFGVVGALAVWRVLPDKKETGGSQVRLAPAGD